MPTPRVADGHFDVRVDALQPDLDTAAAAGELDGVGQQVPQHLPQTIGVARDRPDAGIEDGLDADALGVGGRLHRRDRVVDDHRQLDRLDVQADLARDDPRHVQHVVDDLGQPVGVALDGLEAARQLVAGQESAAQQPRVADDRVQRRPQLVRQHREELVLHAVGVAGLDEQPRVLEGDGRPPGDAFDDPLVLPGEHADAGAAEEQAAEDVAPHAPHRHGQIAAHRQVSRRHAVKRRVLAEARVGGDVVEPDGRLAAERRREQPRWRADAGTSRTPPWARPTACRACRRRRTRRRARCRRTRRTPPSSTAAPRR